MGLDQYLYKKTYIKNWEHQTAKQRHKIRITGPNAKNIKQERICYIEEEVAYWRKANHIQKWFADNCHNGVENGSTNYIEKEKLEELLDLVTQVLAMPTKANAANLLPTEEGFFFGGTDYDEWYFTDCKQTKKMLEELLNEPGDGEFYYSANW